MINLYYILFAILNLFAVFYNFISLFTEIVYIVYDFGDQESSRSWFLVIKIVLELFQRI